MKKFKYIITIFLILFLLQIGLALAGTVQDIGEQFGKAGLGESSEGPYTIKGSAGISEVVGTIITAAISLVGVIFLILMIYGGYLWMTAHGNEEQVTKAKNIIFRAIIGLIIVVSAYAITWFIYEFIIGETLKEA